MTYYNDIDPDACAWTEELQRDGLIPAGVVDPRSIADVAPADLADHAQCHFFSGISGWAYALELADWGPTRPVWTASLPCQPFSCAGKRKGAGDERHLWPVFHDLVAQCQPAALFGEQVSSADGRDWLAAVLDDLGALGYIAAGADLCAAGVGAPHIRQRLYWGAVRVADTNGTERKTRDVVPRRIEQKRHRATCDGAFSGLADGSGTRLEIKREQPTREELAPAERSGEAGGLPDTESNQSGLWHDVVYLPCADGKSRPIESAPGGLAPGFPPLVVRGSDSSVEASAQARAMRLKGYGNSIVPQLAAAFVSSFCEAVEDLA